MGSSPTPGTTLHPIRQAQGYAWPAIFDVVLNPNKHHPDFVEASQHSTPLEHRRLHTSDAKRILLHPQERLLIFLVLAQLIFLPWALGGMRLWAQYISLGIASVTFIISLLPRRYTEENSRAGRHHLSLWPKLFRFPLFWIGLVLMGYLAIQGFNPAWKYVLSTQGWWMERISHIEWLPHGTESPLLLGNPWRSTMIYGAAWLSACAIWVGITRRRSLQIILLGLVSNATLLAIIAISQRITGTNKILWFVDSPNQIWGTFFYRNHGGAWFALMASVFFGMAFWHYLKALRTFAKSSPAAVYAFLSLLMIVCVVVSHSRGAVLSTLLFLVLFLVTFLVRQFTLPPYPQKNIISIFLLMIFLVFGFIGLKGLGAQKTWDRMEQLFEGESMTLSARRSATQATFDMWRASPWLGHGAGSFEFIFPIYQQHYPEIYEYQVRRKKQLATKRFFWEHAHNDIAQTLAEFGVIGSLIPLLAFLWGLARFIKTRAWANPIPTTILLGMLGTITHSWGEFVFQNPAILVTWICLGIIGLRWAELDPTTQSR